MNTDRLLKWLVAGILALWTFAKFAGAQVHVSLTPMDRRAVERALSRRAAKTLTVWIVAIENGSGDSIAVSESAVIRRVPQILPYPAKGAELLVLDAQKNSGWQKAGKAVQGLLLTAVYLQATDTIRIGREATIGLAAAGSLGPHVLEFLKGAEAPLVRNFSELAWREPIRLEPGAAATAYLFASPHGRPEAVSFDFDVASAKPVKLVQ